MQYAVERLASFVRLIQASNGSLDELSAAALWTFTGEGNIGFTSIDPLLLHLYLAR
jgi:hypothetical protein